MVAIVVPPGTTSITTEYKGDPSISSITIPASVISIGDYAFSGCGSLAAVIFEPGSQLETIGKFAFAIGLHSGGVHVVPLTSISIPASVTIIDKCAFYGCGLLTTVTFEPGSQLKTIGDFVFGMGFNPYNISFHSVPLTSISIPASVTSIGNYAFQSCASLTNVKFEVGSQLTTIGDYAFITTTDLNSINIPASVTSIGISAFSQSGLTSITVDPNNKTYLSEDGVIFSVNKTEIISFLSNKQVTGYIIPDTVTHIQQGAFLGVTIPEPLYNTSLTTIWRGSTTLNSITIPASVTSIGNYAFQGCTSLTTVTFEPGSQLKTIGDYAFAIDFIDVDNTFYIVPLRSILIPASVTSVGNYAFQGCTSLTTVTFEQGSQLATIGDYAFAIYFFDSNNVVDYYFPIDYSDTFYIVPLTSISIPASVTSIGNYAFQGCTSLTTVTFEPGSQLTTIRAYAFAVYIAVGSDEYTKVFTVPLTSISIPARVTSIGDYAFYGCASLATVIFDPESQLTTIGEYAFAIYLYHHGKGLPIIIPYIVPLTSISIPASVTSIGDYAFQGCASLKTLTVETGSQLNTITQKAFALVDPYIIDYTEIKTINPDRDSGYDYIYSYDPIYSSANIPLETVITYTNLPKAIFDMFNAFNVTTLALNYSGAIEASQYISWTALENLTLGPDITYVAVNAFNGSKVKTLVLNYSGAIEAAQYISWTALENLTIGPNIHSIGQFAFAESSHLKNVRFLGNVPTLGLSSFMKVPGSTVTYGSNTNQFYLPTYFTNTIGPTNAPSAPLTTQAAPIVARPAAPHPRTVIRMVLKNVVIHLQNYATLSMAGSRVGGSSMTSLRQATKGANQRTMLWK
jgi:hypothetical protein